MLTRLMRYYCCIIQLAAFFQPVSSGNDSSRGCAVPSDLDTYPDFAQEELRALWVNYVPGTDCSRELQTTDDIIAVLLESEFDSLNGERRKLKPQSPISQRTTFSSATTTSPPLTTTSASTTWTTTTPTPTTTSTTMTTSTLTTAPATTPSAFSPSSIAFATFPVVPENLGQPESQFSFTTMLIPSTISVENIVSQFNMQFRELTTTTYPPIHLRPSSEEPLSYSTVVLQNLIENDAFTTREAVDTWFTTTTTTTTTTSQITTTSTSNTISTSEVPSPVVNVMQEVTIMPSSNQSAPTAFEVDFDTPNNNNNNNNDDDDEDLIDEHQEFFADRKVPFLEGAHQDVVQRFQTVWRDPEIRSQNRRQQSIHLLAVSHLNSKQLHEYSLWATRIRAAARLRDLQLKKAISLPALQALRQMSLTEQMDERRRIMDSLSKPVRMEIRRFQRRLRARQ